MLENKICTKCSVEKSLDNFSNKRSKSGKYYPRPICKDCHKQETKLWRENNPEKAKSLRKNNYPKSKEKSSEYYYENKDSPVFKAKRCFYEGSRRSGKLKATPVWLSKEQKQEILNFYWLAKDLEVTSGQEYHVDHTVPIKGTSVCGLHVPWNLQILPADINMSKGNKYGNLAY